MNMLDQAIAYISPKRGAERAMYRAQLLAGERIFDAAKQGRRTEGWQATGASANAETQLGLDRLRWRARDLERNNSMVAGMLMKLPSYMVGSQVSMRVGKGGEKRMNANFKKFAARSDISGRTNFDAQMHLAARTIARDGEVLLSWQDLADVNQPLALHVLEVDYLDTAKSAAAGDNTIIQGVEYDRDGRRVAYWMFDQHPGETIATMRTSYQSRRIPAERIDHVFDIFRPGQARGIPWSAPVAMRSRDVAEFEDAEVLRKKIEACFSVFIRQTELDGTKPLAAEQRSVDATGRPIDRLSPGVIYRLRQGEDVTFGEPRQQVQVSDFLKTQWHMISVGMGLPYFQATGDVSNANYSSQRAAMIDFWNLLDHWQWHMLAPLAYQPAWRRVAEAYGRLGQGPRGDDIELPQIDMPKREWIDPDKDGKAVERDIRIGRLTWPQMISMQGYDPDEQLAEIEEFKPKVEAAGLEFGGAKPPAPPPGEEPSEDDNEPPEGEELEEEPEEEDEEPSEAERMAAALVDVTSGFQREAVRLADRFASSVAELVEATRLAPAPTVNVAAPVVNVSPPSVSVEPHFAIHQTRGGLDVVRDRDNRITGLVPAEGA